MMNRAYTAYTQLKPSLSLTTQGYLLRSFCSGLCLPFGFAPFHLPGFIFIGLALFFFQLSNQTRKQAFMSGFMFGLGFLGLGVSWVYVSIHEYGHLNILLSGLITLLFISYLSLFPALVGLCYVVFVSKQTSRLMTGFIFSALWCLSEALRGSFMGGFPWLLVGMAQVDTPLKYLFPLVGVYGVGFLTCFAATCLVFSLQPHRLRHTWLMGFLGILLLPLAIQNKSWSILADTPLSVGVVQANLSMRDKWDESLFWQLLEHYKTQTEMLLNKVALIVLPESAIPLPEGYLNDFLNGLDEQATAASSAILLGIPQIATWDESFYYNSLIALGNAKGSYLKQHLVPFGEFIPDVFQPIVNQLGLPLANLKPGQSQQALIEVHHHPIATLICYELAYPTLLRQQLPNAEWIVSISDDGWFGHSLAMYQQLQMAQSLSLQTARYQVVSNNDGLSSIINDKGDIVDSLPAFSAGVLVSSIYPAQGKTPWICLGDSPLLFFSGIILLFALAAKRERRYPNKPN